MEMGVGRMGTAGRAVRKLIVVLAASFAFEASGQPGGTPAELVGTGVYCARCHASTAESDLEGLGERARAELAENKHLKAVREGSGVYSALPPEERGRIAELLAAVDRQSTVVVEAPAEVGAGATFEVRIELAGGAGPRVAVGLFDRPHRLYARALALQGFEVVGTPRVEGGRLHAIPAGDGGAAGAAGSKRPTFFDVEGIASSADEERWASARIVITLKAPTKLGDYGLVAAYLYGTEKAVEGTTRNDDSRFGPRPLGGVTGASGRIRFSQKRMLRVVAPAASAALSGGA
jgi:hypothetical protein